ncbi:MAG TPA: hypothetical protein VGP93_16950, partial [Polyangiaceae bacterium]|nr:hypothetical protein [Polyangiaceae bacterium]
MAKAFEQNGLFYRVLAHDAERWSKPRISGLPMTERRPLSHHPRPRSHRLSELPPPERARPNTGGELFLAQRRVEELEQERRGLLEEVVELRYQVAESKRSTEERKGLYVRELNKLRLERDTLTARLQRLEGELAGARSLTVSVTQQRSKDRKLRRGLVATSGVATA